MTIFGVATLGVLALYLALFFLASNWAARAAGRPVWLFGRATGRDRLAALGFRVAFALAFVGPLLQTAIPALSEADPPRAETLRTIGLDEVESAGYVFQTDLTVRTVRAGLRVVEVPITFIESEIGESKMDGDVVKESMRRITGWGLEHRRRQAEQILRRDRRWHAL